MKKFPKPGDATRELTRLLREARLTPYLHREDCAMWKQQPCDKQCGPRKS